MSHSSQVWDPNYPQRQQRTVWRSVQCRLTPLSWQPCGCHLGSQPQHRHILQRVDAAPTKVPRERLPWAKQLPLTAASSHGCRDPQSKAWGALCWLLNWMEMLKLKIFRSGKVKANPKLKPAPPPCQFSSGPLFCVQGQEILRDV